VRNNSKDITGNLDPSAIPKEKYLEIAASVHPK
jgi:hypothetical protein